MKSKNSQRGKPSNRKSLQSLPSDVSHALNLERLGPIITERIIWNVKNEEAKIALTFDDGPHPGSTPLILETLEKFHVPATFFMVGKHIVSHTKIAEAVVKGGQEIGNHTYTHALLPLIQDTQIRKEIMRTHELLKKLAGYPPRFLRPPQGAFTKRSLDIVEELGYKTVVGDVYPRDPHRPGTQRIIQRVLDRTVPGSIIILHDGGSSKNADRSQTVEATKEIVPRLQDKGFTFVTVSQLLASASTSSHS
jgi:peptidoglycan/xylan/chitin deacetylase (PgdA/CDA1 family)